MKQTWDKQIIKWFGLVFLIIIFIPIDKYAYHLFIDKTPEKITKGEAVRHAKNECMYQIEQALKDPKSVEYDHSRDTGYYDPETKLWHIVFFLRAKNSFGAIVPGQYECIFEINQEQNGDSNYKIVGLSEIN